MKRCQALLGTYVEIMIPEKYSTQQLNHAFRQAFQEIQLVEQLMSFHRPSSDLNQMNQYAFQMDVAVHPYTYVVLSMAKQLFNDTQGAFDCSMAPELQSWGLLPSIFEIDMRCRGNLDDLNLKSHQMVSFTKPLCLDLGGIAKGYAVDRAIEILKMNGIAEAVVNAGGDMRVLGQYVQEIYIRHPLNPRQLIYIGQLSDGAIATSAIYYSRGRGIYEKQSALVVPQTKTSILKNQSYSVLAQSCMVADGLTKALAIHQDEQAGYLKTYKAAGVIL